MVALAAFCFIHDCPYSATILTDPDERNLNAGWRTIGTYWPTNTTRSSFSRCSKIRKSFSPAYFGCFGIACLLGKRFLADECQMFGLYGYEGAAYDYTPISYSLCCVRC
jgi:hypothetical protein